MSSRAFALCCCEMERLGIVAMAFLVLRVDPNPECDDE